MSKAAKKKPAEKFVCPECAKEFQNLAGLRGHLAYKHKAPPKVEKSTKPRPPKAREKEKKGDSVTRSETGPGTTTAPAAPIAAVSNTAAHEHLKTALQELTQRNRQIDEELARMESLQVEKEMMRKQIDAVNSALQAFGG